MSFEVWAPRAVRVDVVLEEGIVELAPSGRGWWAARDLPAVPGTSYVYRLDGGDLLPDPRSRWQPRGVFGPSRILDHGQFVWTDDAFVAEPLDRAVLYELHVGTFTDEGTFRAAIEKLPILVELGITHVELMPVAGFSGERGWGYDGVALFSPHAAYGAPDDLKALVDACHGCGLAVLFDVVHNHLGPEANFLPRFGPYLSERHRTPWGAGPNLDGPDSGVVRRFFLDSALAWLRDYHGDGLRLDAVHALIDLSPLHFLEELRREVDALSRRLGRSLVLVAESDANDPRLVRPLERGGFALDAIWNDDFHHALHAVVTGESDGYYADFGGLRRLETAYARGFVYAGEYSPSRRRRHGRPAPDLSGGQLVAFAQNHDQIGNRARGDRLASSLGLPRLRLVAGLLLTAPFVPLLFQGEEWGALSPFLFFCDYRDEALREAVWEGRRKEFSAFGWDADEIADPGARDTFLRSKLRWTERDEERHRALWEWHRSLLRLRREIPDLRSPHLGADACASSLEEGWLRIERGRCVVVANVAEKACFVPLGAARTPLLTSPESVEVETEGAHLPPDGFAILGPGA